MDHAQTFWDELRPRLSTNLLLLTGRSSDDWTRWRTVSAEGACCAYAGRAHPDRPVIVRSKFNGGEYRLRDRPVDVTALDAETQERFVLFETEISAVGRKDLWTEEFAKLCHDNAAAGLRVVSGVFRKCRRAPLVDELSRWLATYRRHFLTGPKGPFCLALGPENMNADPGQCWVAFAVEHDFSLRRLDSATPFNVYRVYHKLEPPEAAPEPASGRCRRESHPAAHAELDHCRVTSPLVQAGP
jgi:hypothetical protein